MTHVGSTGEHPEGVLPAVVHHCGVTHRLGTVCPAPPTGGRGREDAEREAIADALRSVGYLTAVGDETEWAVLLDDAVDALAGFRRPATGDTEAPSLHPDGAPMLVARVQCPHRIGLCWYDPETEMLGLLPCPCNDRSTVLDTYRVAPENGDTRARLAELADDLAAFDCVNDTSLIPRGVDVPDDYETGLHEAADRIRATLATDPTPTVNGDCGCGG